MKTIKKITHVHYLKKKKKTGVGDSKMCHEPLPQLESLNKQEKLQVLI